MQVYQYLCQVMVFTLMLCDLVLAKTTNNKVKQQQQHKKSKSSSKPVTLKFPKLSEFFAKQPNIKSKLKLSQCDVTIKKEQCFYKTVPKKRRCLLFRNVITDIVPYYKAFIGKSKLVNFQKHEVKDIQINTCTRKVTLTTFPQGNITIFPNAMEINNVEGAISLPVPFGDFQMLAGGEWKLGNLKMKVKFNRDHDDTYNVKGFSEKEVVKVSDIGDAFDIDILPNIPISLLLQKIGINKIGMRDCRLYGTMHPRKDVYELAFSGEPAKDEYSGGRLRVFITKNKSSRNLAVLLELQDYSPLTLLKNIYGPSIGRATVLRDRNQTIALYVSSQPTSQFSSILTAHGSGRWIHRDSNFDPGAYLLVTLPFPKRKAVDMKIQLHSDSLHFSIPESEKLYSDLALSAILPEKIMHLGVDRWATVKDKNNKIYSKIRILQFKYFIFNNTYLAAAESHLSVEEELSEFMPAARTPPRTLVSKSIQKLSAIKNHFDKKVNTKTTTKKSLDAFFATELENEKVQKQKHEKKTTKTQFADPLLNAQQAGLL